MAPSALAQARKPRVPPGLDPGGVAVAIAGAEGIDYTAPQIAARLARDGEGELIGWDFVDADRRPYAAHGTGRTTGLAQLLLGEAPRARLVPFRTRLETIALGRLMVFTGQGPARVLLLLTASDKREDWAAFAEAAAHFRHVLAIVPASLDSIAYPGQLGLDTGLTVAASTPEGKPAAGAEFPPADLAAPAAEHSLAATRIAALAARLLAAEPQLAGAALKARILSSARPVPGLRHGWIAAPSP